MIRRQALGAILIFLFASEAVAQRLTVASSDPQISITSTFTGQHISFFGNIEREFASGTESDDGNYHIVIAVQGPSSTHVARKKTSQFGIWLNGEEVAFEDFPTFYYIVSDLPLDRIATPAELSVNGLAFDSTPHLRPGGDAAKAGAFLRELIRLMQKRGLYRLMDHGVIFHSDTFYSTRIQLPAHVPSGTYFAVTHLFQNGKLITKKSQRFLVQKIGFERFVSSTAENYSLLYGIVSVMLALFTGWLSGVAFRR